MRASHLFGTLEMPGQKAYPSKDIEYGMFNPSQGMFEVKQALVRKKTSTGRLWNEYNENLPVDKMDIYPKRDYSNEYPLSKPTGSLFTDKKATNPEMITGFGYLPNYPDEARIKGLLEREAVPRADKAAAREFFGGIKAEELKGIPDVMKIDVEAQKIVKSTFDETNIQKLSSRFNEAQIEKLKRLGFSDETIGEAIRKEAEKDLAMVLEKPGMFKEADIASAIQTAYENYILSKKAKTGENAAGIGAAGDTQNPGVRANAGPAEVAQAQIDNNFAPLPVKTGVDRMKALMTISDKISERVSKKKAFDMLKLAVQNQREATLNNYKPTSASNVAAAGGGGEDVGTGPGGTATFSDRALDEMSVATGDPTKPQGRPPGSKNKPKIPPGQTSIRGFMSSK